MKSLSGKFIKYIMLALSIVVFVAVTVACQSDESENNDKLSVVTTLFPQYDFVSQIGGDKVDVTLLLNPGTEAHDYDPAPSDVIKINNADLFIYTGENMEVWASNILGSIDNKELNILDISKNIALLEGEEEEEEHDGHNHEYDPHIWTSPRNAIVMINNILDELIKIDGENEEYYKKNANEYISSIEELDKEIRQVVSSAEYDTLYFGGRFALLYFVKEYGLNYISAFDSCSSETEPSAKLVTEIVDEMKENGARTVFYEELADPKTAVAIAEEIGGETLLLHSCHNVSKEEFDSGATYVSIMKKNIENLKIGLNRVN